MTDNADLVATMASHVHLYCRVSTAEQSREGYSLGEQERQCRAIAETYYSEREIVLWVEPGVSAGVPLAKRKTGGQMVAALRAGDVLIASKLDRVFRNLIDALTQIEDFVAREIACVLLDIGTEPISSTGAGKLQFQLLSAMGEFERTRLRERLADSRAARRAKGIPLSRNAPIGFMVEGEGRDKRLVPNLGEQEMLLEMRRMHEKGCSFAAIAREIAKCGYRNRRGNIIDSAHIRLLLRRDLPEMQSSRSDSIKAAIARKREHGWIPGNPRLAEARRRGTATLVRLRVERDHRLEPIIRNLVKQGYTSYRTIAIMLNAAKIPTLGRAREWYPASVRKVMRRLELHSPYLPGRPPKPSSGTAAAIPEPGPQPPPTPLNTSLRRWRKKRNVQIFALRDDGLSVDQIAARLPLVDANTVRRVLRESGLPRGLKRAAAKGDDIRALRRAGRPVAEIADKTGLHVRSIYRFLAKEREDTTTGDTAASVTYVLPVIWSLQAVGVKRQAIAGELNRRQIPGPKGEPWTFNAVRRLMSQHREPSGVLREHKIGAETVAVLPLILQLQRDGHDASAIASRLQGKFTGRIWSKAAIEAVLEHAGGALATLPAAIDNAAAPGDLTAAKSLPLGLDGHDLVATSPQCYDRAWVAAHVWPTIITLQANGYKTAAAISHELNARGILTPDGIPWCTKEVHRLLNPAQSRRRRIRY
jgi:DNA invertase Pin-like site-specific DNA recombinase